MILTPYIFLFPIVWDGIIPIVDYTNYLILGITVALAWELPSKPPSEIIEELKDKLNDGSLGLHRNDTVNKIKYIDIPSINNKYQIPSFYKPSKTKSYYFNKNWKTNDYLLYNNEVKTHPQMNFSNFYTAKYHPKYAKHKNYSFNSWMENDPHWRSTNNGQSQQR